MDDDQLMRARPLRRGRGTPAPAPEVWAQLREDLGAGWAGSAEQLGTAGLWRAAFSERSDLLAAALQELAGQHPTTATDGADGTDDETGGTRRGDVAAYESVLQVCATAAWALARCCYKMDAAPVFADGIGRVITPPGRLSEDRAQVRVWRRALSGFAEHVCRSPKAPDGAKLARRAAAEDLQPAEVLAALVTLADGTADELAVLLAGGDDADEREVDAAGARLENLVWGRWRPSRGAR